MQRRGSESSKGRGSGLRPFWVVPPSGEANKIESGTSGEVLQLQLGVANKASVAHIKDTYSLGDGAFNACPCLVTLLKSRLLLFEASLLQGEVFVCRGLEMEATRLNSGFGTEGADRASEAILLVETHRDRGIALVIDGRRPSATGFALGTSNGLGLPVHDKVCDVIAVLLVCLQTGIWTHGSNQFDAVLRLTVDEVIDGDIASIDEMFGRQEPLLIECLMNLGQGLKVWLSGGGGFNMGQEVGRVGITTFGQVDFATDPARGAFAAEAGLNVVG